MSSAELEVAQSAIASEIGPDVGEFTPEGEKHLFGWDDMLLLAGAFLMAFLTAFAKSAGEEAGKKLGAAFVDYIAQQIKVWRSKSAADQSAALKDAAAAAEKIAAAKPELLAAASDAAGEALASALGKVAESDIAKRIAARVCNEALKFLSPKAAK